MSSVVLLLSLNLIFNLVDDVQAIDRIRVMNQPIDRHLKHTKGRKKTKKGKLGKKTKKGKSMKDTDKKGTTFSAPPTITPSVVVTSSNAVSTVPSAVEARASTTPSDSPSASPTESTQRIALTNFYYGISVGARSALTNWLVGDECNTDNPWNGITCVDGQVTRLDLCKY